MKNKKFYQDNEYFSSILNTIPHGIYIVNKEFDVQYINSVVEKDFGPVADQKCYQYLHERTEVCPWCQNDTVFSGKSVSWEWYSKKNNKYYNLYDCPIQNPDGTISKFEIFTDITELKCAEKRYEQAEKELRRYEQIIEATDDHMSFLDQNYTYLAVNNSYLKGHQKTREEIIGNSVEELMGRDLFEQFLKEKLDRCLAGEEIHYQAWFSFPGIGQQYMDVSYYPFLDSNDEITGIVVSSHNITEQKELEIQKVEKSRQEEQRLKLESLKTMAGAIAHRFNNAMTAVLGNLELMQLTLPDDAEEYDMAVDAAKAAKGASQVGSMMLSYVGQRPLQLQTLSLSDLARESVTTLKNHFQPQISLKFYSPSQDIYCSVDPPQIKEVLESVLTNALEALENAKGTIEISFGSQYCLASSFPLPFQGINTQNGVYSFCQIKDTGHGINPENLLRIFEPFYTTKFVGRGLGLALTVGIMQSHHGAISVESSQGEGTTVKILLPSIEPSSQKRARFLREKESETAQFSGNILLVDDEEMVLEVGCKMLEALGYTVSTAMNGQEAIDKILKKDTDFCAAIIDVSMSGLDGIGAMKEIKNINPVLPIILSSGYSENDFFFKKEEGGKPDAFLNKPFHLSDVKSILEKLLS